jgi:hypothetical protein
MSGWQAGLAHSAWILPFADAATDGEFLPEGSAKSATTFRIPSNDNAHALSAADRRIQSKSPRLAFCAISPDIPKDEVCRTTSLEAARLNGFDLRKLQSVAGWLGVPIGEIAILLRYDGVINVNAKRVMSQDIAMQRLLAA